MDKMEELLIRGVANIIPGRNELKKLLTSRKKLNIYLGIDPTATKIHLGHAVPLRKLQAFAELGHNVTFLIGDFTALIGDTSDKESERPVLTSEEIEKNFETYKKQAEKILDFSKVEVRHNSEWLKKLMFEDIIKLTQHFSANDFVSRELIRKRLDGGKRVGLHEVLYPVMQGYDSYYLDTDIQIGGTDQTFNMQAGRTLQKNFRKKESFVLAIEFLTGTDGRKMSKTWGNAIWLDDSAQDMYAKVMSVRDDLIIQYYTLATNTSFNEISNIEKRLKSGENPMDIKKELAFNIVSELNNKDEANKAQEFFEKTVQKKELPKDVPIYQYSGSKSDSLIDLLLKTELAESRSEAKRLIEQGGITINNETLENPNIPLSSILTEDENVVQRGKRNIIKVKVVENGNE